MGLFVCSECIKKYHLIPLTGDWVIAECDICGYLNRNWVRQPVVDFPEFERPLFQPSAKVFVSEQISREMYA